MSESFPIRGGDRSTSDVSTRDRADDRPCRCRGSGFLGRPLVLALSAAGYDVREVQANRAAERRERRRRAKTDIEDAEAVARETLADPRLPPAGKHATSSPPWQTLTVLRDWRASLVLQRVRLLTEAEAALVTLPVAIRDALPATSRVLPQLVALADGHLAPGGLAPADRLKRERLATSLLDITTLTQRIKELDQRVPAMLAELGSTLTDLHGVGVVTVMDLLVKIGDPHRFTTEAQFARWCGIAPVAVSSGEGHRPGPPTSTRPRRELGGQLDPAHHPRHAGSLPSTGQKVFGVEYNGD